MLTKSEQYEFERIHEILMNLFDISNLVNISTSADVKYSNFGANEDWILNRYITLTRKDTELTWLPKAKRRVVVL